MSGVEPISALDTCDGSLAQRAGREFAAYCAGDEQRMSGLVDLLTPVLWHLARSCGLDHAASEDVVQTAWLRLVEHATAITDPQTVLAWLGTTVRREAWRRRGDDRRTVPASVGLGDLEPPGTPQLPDQAVTENEDLRVLIGHFRALSPRCQQILRVICQGGRPDYASLSEAVGIPVGSIGPTRGRCLAALRAALLKDPSWSPA